MKTTAEERFWSKVDRSGGSDACWPWTGACNSTGGYGNFGMSGKTYRAHRLAFTMSRGIGYREPEMVLHSCDNPPCCNPAHLSVGNNSDNIRQAYSRGLLVSSLGRLQADGLFRGEKHYAARLTKDQVLRIINDPRSLSVLAKEYGVCFQHISDIKRGKKWKSARAVAEGKEGA